LQYRNAMTCFYCGCDMCGRIVRNKFAEKVKHTLYGRRDAAVKLGDATSTSRHQSSSCAKDNIARLLAAATNAELVCKIRSRNYNCKSLTTNLLMSIADTVE